MCAHDHHAVARPPSPPGSEKDFSHCSQYSPYLTADTRNNPGFGETVSSSSFTPPASKPNSPVMQFNSLSGSSPSIRKSKISRKSTCSGSAGGSTSKQPIRAFGARSSSGTTSALHQEKQNSSDSTSPILPKVRLHLNLTDEDDWPPSVGGGTANNSPAAAFHATKSSQPKSKSNSSLPFPAASPSSAIPANKSKEGGRRSWSQTTTTTTTRKTELRTWKYSIPTKDEDEELNLFQSGQPISPPWPSLRGHRPRSSSSTSSRKSLHREASPRATRNCLPPAKRSNSILNDSKKSRRTAAGILTSSRQQLAAAGIFPNTNALISTSDLMQPVVSAFSFLMITTMACMAITGIMLASLGLTLADDCGKRVADVSGVIGEGRRLLQGSIVGMRSGVGRMVGGALDLKTWSTAVGSNGLAWTSARAAAPTMTFSDESSDSLDETPRTGRPINRTETNSMPTNLKSKKLRKQTFKRNSFTSIHPQASRPSSRAQVNADNVWTEEEEDNLPYDVPFTTPSGTRANSPTRSKYPPRPPLRLLLPSVFFALLYTLFKVVTTFWKTQPKKANARH